MTTTASGRNHAALPRSDDVVERRNGGGFGERRPRRHGAGAFGEDGTADDDNATKRTAAANAAARSRRSSGGGFGRLLLVASLALLLRLSSSSGGHCSTGPVHTRRSPSRRGGGLSPLRASEADRARGAADAAAAFLGEFGRRRHGGGGGGGGGEAAVRTRPAVSRPTRSTRAAKTMARTSLRLSSSSSSSGGSRSPQQRQKYQRRQHQTRHVSAAAEARREEERRRIERRDDVRPGHTSARPGETDYQLFPSETERAYLSSADDVERMVYVWTERGLDALRTLELERAKEAFDIVYKLKPNAYLWQLGVVQYYLNDLRGAAHTFATNAALFETKFMSPASEERIWRDACELKLKCDNTKSKTKKKKNKAVGESANEGMREGVFDEDEMALPRIPEKGGLASDLMNGESRKVMRIARDLFSASVSNDHSTVALSRAKLRSICGPYGSPPTPDRKMWRLTSWYYLGLHYDALNDPVESKRCMKMALRQSAGQGNGEDIVRILPILHMTRRDWFDDDDFESHDGNGDGDGAEPPSATTAAAAAATARTTLSSSSSIFSTRTNTSDDVARNRRSSSPDDLDAPAASFSWSALGSGGGDRSGNRGGGGGGGGIVGSDAIVKESIEDTIDKMKLAELQDALKRREIKSSGSKADLKRRLVDSLLREAGFV